MGDLWGGILTSSIVVVAFFALFLIYYYVSSYFGLKKRRDYVRKFQEELKPGVKVLFGGGIVGKITKTDKEYLSVEISKGLEIQVSRYGIQEIIKPEKSVES